MIICRTPYRISFFGGGTDYPAWYRKHGGATLATTIDKYCYLSCRYLPPFFEHRFKVVYSKVDDCRTVDEISHPAVRAVLKYTGMAKGLEIHYEGDLPARSGMGSSSSFTVGLLHAVYALQGKMANKRQLATESIHIEQDILGETVGSQDQILAAFGGFNLLEFQPNGEFSVRPLTLSSSRVGELNEHLMLFYTGIKRTASDVASTYVLELDSRTRQLRILRDLVEESLAVLTSDRPIVAFGELLHEAWMTKRSLSHAVSNGQVEAIYEAARAAGAVGGKLTGAGGGGFLLLFAPPSFHHAIRQRLSRLIHVPIAFERGGSQIIFYEADPDYSAHERGPFDEAVEPFRELAVTVDPAQGSSSS